MKEIRLGDLVNKTKNKTNKQISFNLRARKLKKFGLTPEVLLDVKFVKPVKFYKGKVIKRAISKKFKK